MGQTNSFRRDIQTAKNQTKEVDGALFPYSLAISANRKALRKQNQMPTDGGLFWGSEKAPIGPLISPK